MTFRRTLLAFVVTLLISPRLLSAAEAAGVQIEHQGKPVAGFTITYDGESDAEMFAALRNTTLSMEPNYQVTSDLAKTNRVQLDGNVVLAIYRRGSPTGAWIDLENLVLVRDTADPRRWRVPDEEVDRILAGTAYDPAAAEASGSASAVDTSPSAAQMAQGISRGVNYAMVAVVGLLLFAGLVALLVIVVAAMKSKRREAR